VNVTQYPISKHGVIRAGVAIVLLLGLLAAPPAEAQTAARKAGRGLAGITYSFLEIPGNMVEVSRRDGVGMGLTVGFAIGVGKLVARTLIGTYELITAPFEAPPGFEPILEPEFPWGYFDDSPPQ
jgi:putative exosortase-associated protein (TIGR04073 family)